MFHDAELKQVVICSEPDNLELTFILQDATKKVLQLSGCKLFRVTDFILQNVVSRLLFYCGDNIEIDVVKEKLLWVASLSDSESFLEDDVTNQIVSDMRAESKALLYLEPSWGAEAVFGFEEATLIE